MDLSADDRLQLERAPGERITFQLSPELAQVLRDIDQQRAGGAMSEQEAIDAKEAIGSALLKTHEEQHPTIVPPPAVVEHNFPEPVSDDADALQVLAQDWFQQSLRLTFHSSNSAIKASSETRVEIVQTPHDAAAAWSAYAIRRAVQLYAMQVLQQQIGSVGVLMRHDIYARSIGEDVYTMGSTFAEHVITRRWFEHVLMFKYSDVDAAAGVTQAKPPIEKPLPPPAPPRVTAAPTPSIDPGKTRKITIEDE